MFKDLVTWKCDYYIVTPLNMAAPLTVLQTEGCLLYYVPRQRRA